MKNDKKKKPHYVNNREFSEKVVEHCQSTLDAIRDGKQEPRIPEYIGECFLKIAEGLSHKPNFVRYTYRDEMVMDAVENCIKALITITSKLLQGQVNLMPLRTSHRYLTSHFCVVLQRRKNNKILK